MSDTEMQGGVQEPDDGTTPDAEMTPSNVDDADGQDPVGGAGAAEPSGVTPESGAWADASPDGFEGENAKGD